RPQQRKQMRLSSLRTVLAQQQLRRQPQKLRAKEEESRRVQFNLCPVRSPLLQRALRQAQLLKKTVFQRRELSAVITSAGRETFGLMLRTTLLAPQSTSRAALNSIVRFLQTSLAFVQSHSISAAKS